MKSNCVSRELVIAESYPQSLAGWRVTVAKTCFCRSEVWPTKSTEIGLEQKRLQVGDEVRVTIVETGSSDKPGRKRVIDPAETLKAKKNYVRRMAKELGWKIQTPKK